MARLRSLCSAPRVMAEHDADVRDIERAAYRAACERSPLSDYVARHLRTWGVDVPSEGKSDAHS